MYQRLAATALLILILSACSTTPPAEPVPVRLPAMLTEPCEPLPALVVATGADMRPEILANRVESERVHAECSARHRAVVNAVNPRAREARKPRSER